MTIEHLRQVGVITTGLLTQAQRQPTAPTPCGDWDVQTLANHLALGNQVFTAALSGGPRPQLDRVVLGPEWGATMRDSVVAMADAFDQPEVGATLYELPIGTVPGSVALLLRTVEQTVHAWDLARASGQQPDGLDDAAVAMYAPSRKLLDSMPSLPGRQPFGARVDLDESARPIDRLVALLGRDPAWVPESSDR